MIDEMHQVAPLRDESDRARTPAILVRVTRGPIVESVHRGHVAVVDGTGRLVAYQGDPGAVTFLRSSAKPFQALPVLTSGAADRFGFSDREIAILCGSHGGEVWHTKTVTDILDKLELGPDALQCGAHPPYDRSEAKRLVEHQQVPTMLHNNCSGKHSGMLALALHLRAPLATYREPGHCVQLHVLEAITHFSGLPPASIREAGDGCGVPTFAMPVQAMACMYARLVHPPADFEEATRAACSRIVRSMMAHPEMVEGTDLEDCVDTAVMRALCGRIVSKVGAEGVYTAGVLPCETWPDGLGIAFKIEDGDGGDRVRTPFATALLDRLGLLSAATREVLATLAEKPITNHYGEAVGEVLPAPDLVWSEATEEMHPA